MDFVTSHFGKMNLWPVEHFYNIFQNKKKSRQLFIIIFNSKMLVSGPENFSPLILGVLGGVIVFEIALQRQVCSISDLNLARGLLESQNGPCFCEKKIFLTWNFKILFLFIVYHQTSRLKKVVHRYVSLLAFLSNSERNFFLLTNFALKTSYFFAC